MLTICAMTGRTGYAERYLAHSDYYDQQRRVQGNWHGRGAELLGLRGEVNNKQFEAVREGLDPMTGQFLRPRHSADRTSTDGSRVCKARSLYDFTFSAPKSVSIQAIVGVDDRLITAHNKAVWEALVESERFAATHVRRNGAAEKRTTGNWVVAAYSHDTSRELDPHLHTHAVAANLTYDGVESRWKALGPSSIYENRAYLTEVYRNELAREISGLGYEIESRCDRHGRDRGFEIRGVSSELLERYSQRSAQRDRAIEEFTTERGRNPTGKEIAILVRETRADKLKVITTEELRQQQQARLSSEERQSLEDLRHGSLEQGKSQPPELTRASDSLQHAKDHLFERRSLVQERELLTEALRYRRGAIDLGHLRGTLELEKFRGEFIHSGSSLTTRENLDREWRMIASINDGIGRYGQLGGTREFHSSPNLRHEQMRAVLQILDSRDFAINFRGAAGTGKTATLQEIDRGLREAGREIMAVASTGSGVEELHKVGFRDAITVSRLLQDETAQTALRHRVLIVDEAGKISGRQMEGILRLAERQQARVLFSGDTRQIPSVEAADALKILERESQMKSVALTGVQRHTHAQYKAAIQTLREKPELGLQKLERMGAVQEVPFSERARTVASLYREMTSDSSQRILVVAATHEEVGRITGAIREELVELGQLRESRSLNRYQPLQWTGAQKRDLSNYREGQVLLIHRTIRRMDKHEALLVDRVESGLIVVRNTQGEERTFTPSQTQNFSVHEQREIDVAPGDRLLLTGNRRDADFRATNGELVKVRSVEGGQIELEDGRAIPANYREFDHGYAVTAHRSRGKTVDSVIISADSMPRELFYVAASRGRSEITVVTSDRERLRESLDISSARLSITALVEERRPAITIEPLVVQTSVPTIELPAAVEEIGIGLGSRLGL
jgi:conjugative relaxase-like TrwC/TraI family protein